MNVVHSGNTYQIYGEALKTYSNLPVRTYEVGFNKMTGFFLVAHNDLTINETKVYGSSPEKVKKVLRAFAATDRNFGVILSGRKGIGKSLFARQLAIQARDYNLPLIIVSAYAPGIANFLGSIEQEVIVLFDEFEKTFSDQNDYSPQEELLSLFDGIDGGKKLFVITCNEVHKLNSYFINRPGRFHYHFILGNPTPEEIKEYMMDKLKPEYHNVINQLIGFSMTVDITYDVLRAIAFELNMGYSFKETLNDLNISKEGTPKYRVRVTFVDGTVFTSSEVRINTYDSDDTYVWVSNVGNTGNNRSLRLDFVPTDVEVDLEQGAMVLDPAKASRYIDSDYFDMDKPEDQQAFEWISNTPIESIVMTRVINDFNYKYCV